MATVRQLALDSNIFSSNEKVVDMDPVLQKEYPEVTPLLSIKNKLAEDAAKDTTIYWSNAVAIPRTITYSAASEASDPGDGAGTITFANYAYLRKDDLLSNPRTGEVILVTDTPTSATVSVYRGWGDSSNKALVSGDVLVFMEGAKSEGSDYTTARSVVQTEDYNRIQQFDQDVQISDLADAVTTHFGGPGSKRNQLRIDMQRSWAIMMEETLWGGTRGNTLLSGETGYRKSMKGIDAWLRSGTNSVNVAGLLTESLFNLLLRKLYETYADKTNITLFCSPFVFGIISQWGRGRMQTSPLQTTYGLRTERYVGDVDVDLVRCPLWTDVTRRGWAFALDLPRIKVKYLKHPKLMLDIQPATAHYFLDRYTTAMTLQFANEAAHAKWYGIKG
jgi:hypothetical protein